MRLLHLASTGDWADLEWALQSLWLRFHCWMVAAVPPTVRSSSRYLVGRSLHRGGLLLQWIASAPGVCALPGRHLFTSIGALQHPSHRHQYITPHRHANRHRRHRRHRQCHRYHRPATSLLPIPTAHCLAGTHHCCNYLPRMSPTRQHNRAQPQQRYATATMPSHRYRHRHTPMPTPTGCGLSSGVAHTAPASHARTHACTHTCATFCKWHWFRL